VIHNDKIPRDSVIENESVSDHLIVQHLSTGPRLRIDRFA